MIPDVTYSFPVLIVGIPGLSFDVMLKMFYEEEKEKNKKTFGDNTRQKEKDEEESDDKPPGSLDLFDQPEMEQFFTKGIRGGQSFIATRHAKGKDDPKSSGEHLLYVDGKKILFTCFLFILSNV